jgi:hypothetical protein
MNRYSYVSRMSVALLLAIGLLSGCAATEAPGPSVVQRMEGEKPAPPGRTGFLGSSYDLLKPGKEGQVALVYFRPNTQWSRYTVEPLH